MLICMCAKCKPSWNRYTNPWEAIFVISGGWRNYFILWGFAKIGFLHLRKKRWRHEGNKMSPYSRSAVAVDISAFCSSSPSSILHGGGSGAHVNLMGPIKRGKDLLSDGMWYHKESSPGGPKLFIFSNTPLSPPLHTRRRLLWTRPHSSPLQIAFCWQTNSQSVKSTSLSLHLCGAHTCLRR